ncbi:MAG: hypothetical protein JXJ20_00610 [Anaerolineae bacterium]|nr:hypothetical protein [Anaerolineae bacterium]
MYLPGTPTILLTVIQPDKMPTYARLYLHFQWRHAQSGRYLPGDYTPRFYAACHWLVIIVAGGMSLLLTPLGLMCWGLSNGLGPIAAWLWVGGGLLLVGGGGGLIASRISQAIARDRLRGTWDMLLLLPDRRHRVILYSIADVYRPLLSMLGLAAVEISALALTKSSGVRLLVLGGLLVVEWLQLQALAITIGCLCGSRFYREYAVFIALLALVSLAIFRAQAGWLVVQATDAESIARRMALVIGPLVINATHESWQHGLLSSVCYLLALEVVVRGLFAWCVARAGNR